VPGSGEPAPGVPESGEPGVPELGAPAAPPDLPWPPLAPLR
jgi:hypothetical protein